MWPLSRRMFLAGISSACLPPLVANQAPKQPVMRSPFRSMVGCELVSREGRMLHVLHDGKPVTVRVSPQASVWRGRENDTLDMLKKGDILDIRFDQRKDGGEEADSIYANLVKYDGQIIRVGDDWIEIYAYRDSARRQMSETPVRIRLDSNTALPDGMRFSDLRPKMVMSIIGVRTDDGHVLATRLF